MARLLFGLALWLGLYVLLAGAHFGTLWAMDWARNRLETTLEDRYGSEAIDREPPYSWGERVVVALDIQQGVYWQESLMMSALMSLPVALFIGIGASLTRKRHIIIAVLAVMVNLATFYLVYLLNEQIALGYLISTLPPVITAGFVVGLVHALVASLVYAGAAKKAGVSR